jgi:hypothetical protein
MSVNSLIMVQALAPLQNVSPLKNVSLVKRINARLPTFRLDMSVLIWQGLVSAVIGCTSNPTLKPNVRSVLIKRQKE